MKRTMSFLAMMLMVLPLGAFAQGYEDLDAAVKDLGRGFASGEARAVVAGLGEGDQVKLQFPGLMSESGFFGRDQASYLLEKLFSSTRPSGFEQTRARKISSEGQYRIEGNWTIQKDGKSETVLLSITLQSKGNRWMLASVQSASR